MVMPDAGEMTAAEVLRRILQVEYRFILYYPQLESMMPDEDTAQKVAALGKSSARHAGTVSKALTALGEEAKAPALDVLPDPLDLKQFFRRQLEFEKLALWLHGKAAELVPSHLEPQFREIAREEEGHITLTEQILQRLERGLTGERPN